VTELESMSQRFSEAGVDVDTKVHFGRPLQDIAEFSETHKIDLIIMSCHPIRFGKTTLFEAGGTLSDKVSVACTCPTLLVK